VGLSHSPVITTDGLALCLDAANPRSYALSGSSWNDLSGNGNSGTLTNGAVYNEINNGTIYLDGSNDYVNFGNILTSLTSISLEIVFMRTATSGGDYYQTILSNSRDCCPPQKGIQLHIVNASNTSSGINFMLWNSSYKQVSNGTIGVNTWYHLAWTYNASSGSFKSYRYGDFNTSTTGTNALDNTTTANLNIGRRVIATGSYFKGYIPMVRIYNRELSAYEIAKNYNVMKGRFGL
jgi:hypothetical protein